jgi:hypothetical protein
MNDTLSESDHGCTCSTIQQSTNALGIIMMVILQLLDRRLHGDALRLQTLHLRAQLVGEDRHVRQLVMRMKQHIREGKRLEARGNR